ncbi:potassium-transporting ATPase subunit KdpA [Timonella sp. A28]|uniref:potassium-transporting ATPase subunit KdpA n=1 Tax=Timonella sp. A28 TaxID=3442640 RepID=UPI003EBB5C8A
MTALFIVQIILLIAALVATYRPLGDYMGRTFTSQRDLAAEKALYRWCKIDARSQQTWQAYARSVLAFSVLGVVALYGILRLQAFLPFNTQQENVPPFLAFNTAVSFVTNTNWQNYSPEQTLGHGAQMLGLTVQNFLSAAVGISVAIALVRGFAFSKTHTIGNFWVDVTRATTRILLPAAFIAAFVLVAGGVIQNLSDPVTVTTLSGGTQSIPGGPVASQEAIKLLGTNGGGFFNANSAHPFENPTVWTNLVEIFLMLAIPFSLPRTFGWMVGSHRQGLTIVAVMTTLFVASFALMSWIETRGNDQAPQLAGAALEGKEMRFGILGSTLFGTTSTSTSTGAVNMMHDSMSSLGSMMAMVNMMLGEISPGGVGSGLYAILIIAIIAVFISGLLVGRTPEYIGKKLGPTHMKYASLYVLVMPTLVLVGTALSFAIPAARDTVLNTSLLNSGPHGLSEVLYAFVSAANNNGSAFAGLTGDTPWLNSALGVVMLLGRFLPIVLVLALAGALAREGHTPTTAGTLPTTSPVFVTLFVSVAVLISALTFFPVLTLGPLAEGIL